MPVTPDDPEIVERLAGLGWTVGHPIPAVTRLALDKLAGLSVGDLVERVVRAERASAAAL